MDCAVDGTAASDVEMNRSEHQDNVFNNDSIDGIPLNGKKENEEEEEHGNEQKKVESPLESVGSNAFAEKPNFNTPPPLRGVSQPRGVVRAPGWQGVNSGTPVPVPVPASTNGPPPQMELWVETKTDDGKAYYYHALTRETTWNKPEGPNVRIMAQSEIEEINKKQQQLQQQQKAQPNQQNLPSERKPDELKPKSETLNEMPAVKNSATPAETTQQHATTHPPPNMMSQPPPQLQQPAAPISQPPPNLAAVPPVAAPITQQPPPAFFGPPGGGMHQPPNFGQMPFGMPPPGYFPGAGAAPNAGPWGMPPWNQPHMHGGPPPPAVVAQEKPAKSLIIKPGVIDPAVIARAAEWSEHRAPDGRPYYYHAARGESVWEKPQALRDMEAARMAAHGATPAPTPAPAVPPVMPPHLLAPNPMMHHMPAPAAIIPPGFDPALAFNAAAAAMSKAAAQTAAFEREKKAAEEKRKKEEEQKKATSAANTAKPVDKSRPISSTPIAGTPWCVVWTGDGRVFFYNPSTRTSVWERPEELLDREDVDKAVNTTPEQLRTTTQTKTVEKEESPPPEKPKAVSETTESKSGAASDTGEPMEEDDEDNEIIKIRDESDSSYEEVPTKKTRLANKLARKTNANEAVVEAEVRAAKERAVVPLETRIKQFKDMLREKDVSAFSTWEKELHKIVFDPRYLLLTSKERKQVFEKYVKDRAEEERKEKRNKMRQKREDFRKLMEDAKLHGKSSFSEFCQRFGKEERYKAIEKVRERESLFNEFIVEVRRREKEEKIQRKEQIRHEFLEMLSERSDIDRHTRWYDIKKKFENDGRYRAVENSGYREEYFLDYLRQLKDDKRRQREQKEREREREKERERERRAERSRRDKEKEKERGRDRDRDRSRSRDRDRSDRDRDRDAKDRKDRDKDKDRDKGKDKDDKEKEKEKEKDKDKSKDKDRSDRDKDKDKDKDKDNDKDKEKIKEREKEKEKEKEKEAKEEDKNDKKDRRRKSEESEEGEHHDDDDENEDGESRHSASEDDEAERLQKERERQLRVEASLREREKEVHRTMAGVLRDRDKEREHHKRDEAIGHFNALLTDLVRNPDLTWKEVKRQLRKDHRWETIETLDREDREKIFNEHIDGLMKKKREKFREMLAEIPTLELTSTWKDIKKLIKDDPRYLKYNNSDKCEREFRDFMKDKTLQAKAALRELLQECKLISHKTIEVIKENSNHLKEIHNILKNDKRYLVLEHMADERSTIIVNYLEELHKRGPPPPPTASESTRRQK